MDNSQHNEAAWQAWVTATHELLGISGSEITLLSCVDEEQRIVLQLQTHGLHLEDKAQFERLLKQRLPAELAPKQLIVNYRRKSPLASLGQSTTSGPLVDQLKTKQQVLGVSIDRRAIPHVREIIVVSSGKGGVGKSTVTANLAVSLSRQGKRVGVLDADIYGPSMPMMFGVEGPMKVGRANKLLPHEAHGVKIVSFGFMSDVKTPTIWRGPLIAKVFEQFCYDVDWGDLDYLVIDLPPGTGDIQLTMIEKLPIHGAIVVSTPQDVALIDAHKALSMFEKLGVPVLGLVENMSYHHCSNCGHEDRIFGDAVSGFVTERQIRLLTQIPLQARVRADGDRGEPSSLVEGTEIANLFSELAKKIINDN